LTGLVNAGGEAAAGAQRVFEVLDVEPAIQSVAEAVRLDTLRGEVEFRDVGLKYKDEKTASLDGISLRVEPNRIVALIGQTGSGKTSFVNLIPRFYDVTGGRITIDGQDIREVTLDSLRAQVGVVQQDTFLFKTEVRENVAYGDPTAEDDRVVDAADTAQLHDYVAGLPVGYDTLVGERGVSLSGGQRQRLSIARSVLLTPRIVVFDDSTAAIDAGTELRIRDALKELNRSRATIVISHRLSSLMHADEILFLDAGRIVERGSHEALLAQNGRYRRLFDLQMGVARENADA